MLSCSHHGLESSVDYFPRGKMSIWEQVHDCEDLLFPQEDLLSTAKLKRYFIMEKAFLLQEGF